MMREKKLVPKRRFEGFNDEWNSKKMKELARFSKGKGYSKRDLVPFGSPIILYGHLYTDYKSYIETVKTYAVKKENSVISQGNEIIVPSSGETAEDIARASTVGISGIILAGDLNIIKPNSTVDSLFLGLSISNSNLQKELIKRVQGSSVVHLYNSDIEEANLSYPTFKEQQKIGQLFKHFDEMIALQQRKIDKTKALKSAYFVEMFPAEGESVPKRRFSGFTGEWEEYSLGELTKINTGGSDAQDAKENGAYPFFVRSEKIQRSDNYTFNGEAILIPGEGRLGEIYHHFIGKFDYHQRVYKISHFDEKLDGKFTFYTMHKTFKKHALKYTVKATVDSLRLPIITEYKLLLPTIKEQQKIGQFFKHLDEMIATHQQKLEKLKATKQGYLHEMFV